MDDIFITRGLGHAIASVRGRGMGQDEHHADIPQWRRPTASARRQRVHVDVTEDVPEVTKDVPHMDEDILERTTNIDVADVEGIAIDGAKGSPADHAEGFPGGPRDPSVLTLFGNHVAHSIWSGEEQPELKLVSHDRKVDKFGRPAPEIEGLVAATRLSPLIRCSVVTSNPGLISTFVERWHREISTFHLPVGELTITLDDVATLLHLPSQAIFLLMELLEVSGEEARAETVRAHGAYVYQSRCHARWWIVAAHAFLLHLVGCTLFSNKSATHVHVVHLEGFQNLGQTGGVAALVHMYDQLNEACQTPTRQMVGYLTLLQIYEHFPSVHQFVTDDAYAETTLHASRWLTTKAHMRGIIGALYRARLDALTITNVCWMPYADHRGVNGFDLISCFQERVVRQFGCIQTIPLPPVSALLSYEETYDMWMHFLDHVAPAGEIYVVPGQDACEGCEAITERLERMLNLRMVTKGTELHEIMQDCLRIARGDASDESLKARYTR
ncbi:Protein MAIN-LIKE 1 [Glycine soja]